MNYSIEVSVSDGVSNVEKGQLLEQLGKEIMASLQFSVTEEVRITGMEVDLLASHKITEERIYVECKAYRDRLSADAITKLLGNVTFHGAASGWLLTTGELGKDAKGLMEVWEGRHPDERRKLQIYTPARLIDLLISSGRVTEPRQFLKEFSIQPQSVCLLLTNFGRFWAYPQIHATAGIPYAIVLFDAGTGKRIDDRKLVDEVSKCDSSFRDLEWPSDDVQIRETPSSLFDESQSVVTVASGDQWVDYRPARPQDFVGREELQQSIFTFFDAVRTGTTSTRLFAIKAPSGWGKSSVLLKLNERSESGRYRNKYFVYAVDVRAATSPRYSNFALVECLRAAISTGFVSESSPLQISDTVNPLNDLSISEILAQLRREDKVIVLMFDQFEEIFSKKELSPLFDNIRNLSTAIDGAQENFILGFAWKTDGAIPTDHPAYHMWHSLSDRRKELTLTPFSNKDISNALRIFSRELGASLNPILKRHLVEHCQGYPWLLKKLCIHVYSLLQSGTAQNEILGRGLRIGELFDRDLSELTGPEIACAKKIAAESPADFFQITEIYGVDTVQILLNRRLVIRRGHRLTLYWDIFRDYVLTGMVPQIPISYLPQTAFRRYFNTVTLLISTDGEANSGEIAKSFGIGRKAADNIVRDMVMVGNAEREGDKLKALQQSEAQVVQQILYFLRNHVVFKRILQERGTGFIVSVEEFKSVLQFSYDSTVMALNTLNHYANNLISWLRSVGLIEVNAAGLMHVTDAGAKIATQLNIPRLPTLRRRRLSYFLGDAPALRVLEASQLILDGITDEEILTKRGFRNAVAVLYSLDAVVKESGALKLAASPTNLEKWLAKMVVETSTICKAKQYHHAEPTINAIELGGKIATFLHKDWSTASCKRYGGALLKWLQWLESVEADKTHQLIFDI